MGKMHVRKSYPLQPTEYKKNNKKCKNVIYIYIYIYIYLLFFAVFRVKGANAQKPYNLTFLGETLTTHGLALVRLSYPTLTKNTSSYTNNK